MTFWRSTSFWLLAILAITATAFWPSLSNQFTNWDDGVYLVNNDVIRHLSWHHVARMFSGPFREMYHPLTLLSFAVEYHFFGLDPHIYHTTNLVLHLLNTLLVFYFIRGISENDRVGLITSLLFGVHPLHVESVAWATERKDMLYAFFFLLSLVFYMRFIRFFKKREFWASFACFAFSLLSKPAGILLPMTLLLLDLFKQRTFSKKILVEKIPFFVLALFSGILGILNRGPGWSLAWIDAPDKLDLFFYMAAAPFWYVSKLVYPFKLAALYPYPSKIGALLPLPFLLAPFLIVLLTFLICRFRRRVPKIAFAAGFFILSLIPALVWMKSNVSWVADRYAYIPSIGFFYLAGEFLTSLLQIKKQPGAKICAAGLLALSIFSFSWQTREQCKVWRDNYTLWENCLRLYGNKVHYQIACLFKADNRRLDGDLKGSLHYYNEAVATTPYSAYAYNNRGIVYAELHQTEKALSDFNHALRLDPAYARAYNNRGSVYFDQGDLSRALRDYNRALRLNSRLASAYLNKSKFFEKLGNQAMARKMRDKALALSGYAKETTSPSKTHVIPK